MGVIPPEDSNIREYIRDLEDLPAFSNKTSIKKEPVKKEKKSVEEKDDK